MMLITVRRLCVRHISNIYGREAAFFVADPRRSTLVMTCLQSACTRFTKTLLRPSDCCNTCLELTKGHDIGFL